MLVEAGQLKYVVKDEKGSSEAQIIYNVQLSKEEEWCGVNQATNTTIFLSSWE